MMLTPDGSDPRLALGAGFLLRPPAGVTPGVAPLPVNTPYQPVGAPAPAAAPAPGPIAIQPPVGDTFDSVRRGGTVSPLPSNQGIQPTPGAPGLPAPNMDPVAPPGAPYTPPVPPGAPLPPGQPSAAGGGTGAAPGSLATPYTPESTRADQLAAQASEQYAARPDVATAGVNALRGYIEQTDPEYQAELRAATQRAAAGGRLGSGMLEQELLSDPYGASGIGINRAKDLNARAMELAGSLAPASEAAAGNRVSTLGAQGSRLFGEGTGTLESEMSQRALEESILNSTFGRQAQTAELGLQGAALLDPAAASAAGGAGQLMSNLALQQYLAKLYGGQG